MLSSRVGDSLSQDPKTPCFAVLSPVVAKKLGCSFMTRHAELVAAAKSSLCSIWMSIRLVPRSIAAGWEICRVRPRNGPTSGQGARGLFVHRRNWQRKKLLLSNTLKPVRLPDSDASVASFWLCHDDIRPVVSPGWTRMLLHTQPTADRDLIQGFAEI